MEIHIEVKRLKNNDYDSFFSFLKNSKKTVVLTGAGISTLSGIKDFRSSNGLYSKEFGHMRVKIYWILTSFFPILPSFILGLKMLGIICTILDLILYIKY